MTLRPLMARALAGEHVTELPQAVSVNIARVRQRLFGELKAVARESAGTPDFERRWVETVNRIFDEAEASLQLALGAEQART